jgi:hypothetical protein
MVMVVVVVAVVVVMVVLQGIERSRSNEPWLRMSSARAASLAPHALKSRQVCKELDRLLLSRLVDGGEQPERAVERLIPRRVAVPEARKRAPHRTRGGSELCAQL